jgi:hypothetical protein
MTKRIRPGFALVVDGINLCTVYGWKNLRADIARHEASGRAVSYTRAA